MRERDRQICILVSPAEWEVFEGKAEYTTPSLDSEGFVHASQNTEQLLWVANRRFPEEARMLVLSVDTTRVGPEIRYEDGGRAQPFPHIYGPLNIDAVVEVRELVKDDSGRFSGF